MSLHAGLLCYVGVDPEDHQPGAAPVQLCLHLCQTDRLMRECFFGGGGLGKVV